MLRKDLFGGSIGGLLAALFTPSKIRPAHARRLGELLRDIEGEEGRRGR